MWAEHWIYSTAIAILIYTVYKKKYVLSIIILSSYSPDIDLIADRILKNFGITLFIHSHPIEHGSFHNITVLLLYAIFIALILNTVKIRLIDSFILASIGFGAHLFEDALVYRTGYRFLWPITDDTYAFGIMDYNRDFFGIANREVLIAGILLVVISLEFMFIIQSRMLQNIFTEKEIRNKINKRWQSLTCMTILVFNDLLIEKNIVKKKFKKKYKIDKRK